MIGIFDSGVGGLSILKAILNQITDQDILYLADQQNFPYGEKTIAQLKKISLRNIQFLIEKGADLIVVACNTATTNTIDYLRAQFSQSFVGVEPIIKQALAKSRTGHILLLSTSATQQSSRLKNLIAQYINHHQVYNLACPQLVNLVESGKVGYNSIKQGLATCLKSSLKDKDIDTVGLGCTHFGLLTDQIERFFKENGFGKVKLIEPSMAIVKQLKRILQKIANQPETRQLRFFTTGNNLKFDQDIKDFLKQEFKSKQVKL